MANTMHDTIRLDTALTGQLPTQTWHVDQGGYADRPYAAVFSERSLTGLLQVHRVTSGGSVIQMMDHQYRLTLTRAEATSLCALVGKVCYFMPHYRDEADPLTTREIVLFREVVEPEIPLDPYAEWWKGTVMLQDADGCAIG